MSARRLLTTAEAWQAANAVAADAPNHFRALAFDLATTVEALEMERDAAVIERDRCGVSLHLVAATLRAICRADRTTYEHHERRPWDGKPPRENGGTIWRTPREQAEAMLRRLARELHITDAAADWREGPDR